MRIFNLFGNNENEQNTSYVKSLLDVASIDSNLDEDELKQIIKIANRFDITSDEVIKIKENSGKIKFVPPSSYNAKVKLLKDLVVITMADKSIDESEIKFCKDLAYKLNIAPLIVDNLIQTLNLNR